MSSVNAFMPRKLGLVSQLTEILCYRKNVRESLAVVRITISFSIIIRCYPWTIITYYRDPPYLLFYIARYQRSRGRQALDPRTAATSDLPAERFRHANSLWPMSPFFGIRDSQFQRGFEPKLVFDLCLMFFSTRGHQLSMTPGYASAHTYPWTLRLTSVSMSRRALEADRGLICSCLLYYHSEEDIFHLGIGFVVVFLVGPHPYHRTF